MIINPLRSDVTHKHRLRSLKDDISKLKQSMKILPVTVCLSLIIGIGFQAHAQVTGQRVPFASQAPNGNWKDPRQQNGCEEASSLMAVAWARGFTFTKKEAEKEIIRISKYEEKNFSSSTDTSAHDTAKRIIHGYFHYDRVEVQSLKRPDDIIIQLNKGRLVIVPVNGRKLKNPYFTGAGPLYHMLVIIGYDTTTREFITNDPGTRRGKNYRYPQTRLYTAIRDYPSGEHRPVPSIKKVGIAVER